MKTSYLDLDGRWAIVLVYDYDVDREYDDLANMIESFGVSPKQTRHSLEILAVPNTGMTVTFPEVRMSLVMISRATSKDQLFNTIAHEMYHSTCGIIRYYGREMCSEDAAYTMGELMRQVITNVINSYR
jgi:hypothetical protein